MGALSGLRVVDLTQMLGGPFCAMHLADHGAEVIKVEPPKGDDARRVPPFVAGESAAFMEWNRNKQSLTLDLKLTEDRDFLLKLLETTDILLESGRPGAMDRLGLGWPDLRDRFPQLIYGALSGYGQTGPAAGKGGFDMMAQALSGLMAINGPREGEPHRLPIPICDLTAGLHLTIGVLLALQARHRTGRGQQVETSLLEAGLSLQVYESAHYFTSGTNPERMGQAHRGIAPYQVFPTADGYMTVGAGQPHFFSAFCSVIDLPDLPQDLRFVSPQGRMDNYDALIEILSQATARKPTQYWISQLDQRAVPCAPVLQHREVFAHEQTLARGMVAEVSHPAAGAGRVLGVAVKLSQTPGSVRSAAPMLGADNATIRRAIDVN